MVEQDTNAEFGACECDAAEELIMIKEEMKLKDEEMHLKDEELALLKKRLGHSEETVKRWT